MDGNVTLVDALGWLYFAPHEQFPNKAVVHNANGGVSIIPTKNGRPLLVLAIVDSSHSASATDDVAPPSASQNDPHLNAAGRGSTSDSTGHEPAQPKPGCCTLQ